MNKTDKEELKEKLLDSGMNTLSKYRDNPCKCILTRAEAAERLLDTGVIESFEYLCDVDYGDHTMARTVRFFTDNYTFGLQAGHRESESLLGSHWVPASRIPTFRSWSLERAQEIIAEELVGGNITLIEDIDTLVDFMVQAPGKMQEWVSSDEVWQTDGQAVFTLMATGRLRKIALHGFEDELINRFYALVQGDRQFTNPRELEFIAKLFGSSKDMAKELIELRRAARDFILNKDSSHYEDLLLRELRSTDELLDGLGISLID